MDLIITLLILLGVAAIVWYVIGKLNLPEPIRIAGLVVLAVVAILVLLNFLPGGGIGDFSLR